MRSVLLAILNFSLISAIGGGSVTGAQVDTWQIRTNADGTVIASAASDHAVDVGTVVTILSVGFNVKRGCRAELGFAVLSSANYGEPIGKQSPPRSEPIIFEVDGVQLPTPVPTLLKYDNGLEAVFSANVTILQALSLGTVAKVRLFSGTPTFEFSISGAGTAIAQAQRQCGG